MVKHLNAEWKDCSLAEFADLNSADIETLMCCIRFLLGDAASDSKKINQKTLEILYAKLLVNKYCTL